MLPRFYLNEHIYHKDAYEESPNCEWPNRPPYRKKYTSRYLGVEIERTGERSGLPTTLISYTDDGKILGEIAFQKSFRYKRVAEDWRYRQLKIELRTAERNMAKLYDKEMVKRDGHAAETNFLSSLGI
jgi:hypothetical protein